MKKFLSILLAAVLVLSMGMIALAAEEEAYEAPEVEAAAAEEEAAPATVSDFSALEAKIKSKGLNSTDMASLMKSAVNNVTKNAKEVTVDDILNLPANVMDDVVTFIFASLKALGVDVDALYEKLASNKVINWFVNTFYKGVALTTTAPAAPSDIPATGSTASLAVFATLSLAAAAAFVTYKKKEA